jgi:tryptophan synthase beta chain
MQPKSFILAKDEMPRQWYNILADIKMNPPLGPDGNPVSPEMLAPVFPMNLIEQEVSSERWIDIPDEVLDVYSHLAPGSAGPRLCSGKGPGYTGPHLL